MDDTNANCAVNNSLNWNEIIAKLIIKHEEAFLKSITGVVQTQYRKSKVNFGTAFKDYLLNAFEKYSRVKTLLYRNEPRFLYEFYEFNDISQPNGVEICCDHVSTLLNHSRFNIILGDGGSGKTMLMRHFFINGLQESEQIPIFVELRYIDEKVSLCDYIYSCLSNLGFYLDKIYFEYALKQGMFLILLDGYDEIKSSARDTFFDRLESFCNQYNDNYFIISSRRNDTFIGWQRFSVHDILPLSRQRALAMISKLDYDNEIKEKFLKKLDETLFDSHSSFASNPLLLSIMLMTFDQYAEIPEKLHVFYSYAFDTLYSMHDATKGGYKRELISKLTSDQFKSVFSDFCFRTYLAGQYQFKKDYLLSVIQQAGEKIPNFDSMAFFNDIQVAVCLICEDGLDYQFTHRSFQEYFTALFLNSLDDSKQKTACRFILTACSRNIYSDKVFDMLKDMGEDRFEKNYIIPVLKEVETFCPMFPNAEQRYFYGLIDYCYISASIDKILEVKEYSDIFPLSGEIYSFERGSAYILVKYRNIELARFVMSLSRYYKNTISISTQKLPIENWEKHCSVETIWNNTKLRNHFLYHTMLGQRIRFACTLLSTFESQHINKDQEFQDMLDSIFKG